MNLNLQVTRRHWTEREGELPRSTYGCAVGFHSVYKKVLLKSAAPIVIDRDLLLSFNPTYVP